MTPWAWDVFNRRPAPTPGMLAELAQLRAALPGYDVIVTSHSPAYRFEATSRPNRTGPGPWCVISTDPPTYGANSPPAPTTARTPPPLPPALPKRSHPRRSPLLTAGSAKTRHTAK